MANIDCLYGIIFVTQFFILSLIYKAQQMTSLWGIPKTFSRRAVFKIEFKIRFVGKLVMKSDEFMIEKP